MYGIQEPQKYQDKTFQAWEVFIARERKKETIIFCY